MCTATLSTFRMLYCIIQKKPNKAPTLPIGGHVHYELDITYNYPVLSLDGCKRMIDHFLDGREEPLPGHHLHQVGSICFFLGVSLLIIHQDWDYWGNFKV